MNPNTEQHTDKGGAEPGLEALLGRRAGRRPAIRRFVIGALVIGLSAAGLLLLMPDDGSDAITYHTEPVFVGNLVVTVTATGKLEPTNQVDVGSEMSGTVAAVFVDDDDRVTRGQVLAELDLALFDDGVARAKAALAVALATRGQAEASVNEIRARVARFHEVARLSAGKVPSLTEMESAEAELARAEASLISADAGVAEARAVLRTQETNLEKARIRSPIDGVVLARAVDPGQTVAASLQAVTLFTIAEDLTQMELKVDVDEADVGTVKAGLRASFAVDAWPGRTFEAVITRVGFNATDSDGVVSYPAVLEVANDDLSLRPGMTGTAEITTLTRENAVLVPNAALRFVPPAALSTPVSRGVIGTLVPRPPGRVPTPREQLADSQGYRQIWVLRDGRPAPLRVRVGATDGRESEILEGELRPGMAVITEAVAASP